MSRDPLVPAVDSLIADLQRLRLQLAEPAAASSLESAPSSDSFELVEPLEPGPRPAGVPLAGPRAVVFSPEWDAALFQATTPEALLGLELSPIQHLVREAPLKTFGDWTPAARIALAYRAGRAARLDLLGFSSGAQQVIAPLPRNTIFICLVCEGYPQGFWCTNSEHSCEWDSLLAVKLLRTSLVPAGNGQSVSTRGDQPLPGHSGGREGCWWAPS